MLLIIQKCRKRKRKIMVNDSDANETGDEMSAKDKFKISISYTLLSINLP